MPQIRDRKELFSLLGSVCESNREVYSRYGKWTQPQIKVFWIEVNAKYFGEIIRISGANRLDKDLFEISYENDTFWIDTGDKRIWQIITFAETGKTNKMIKEKLTINKGADRIWLTEKFMVGIQRKLGYNNRGFGIKFKDILTLDDEVSDFSAKFWLGKHCMEKQKRFLDSARETFSISTIRFGVNESKDQNPISGELYELYYNGHITITTSDDIENVIHVLNTIRNYYKEHLEYLEKENEKKLAFIEIIYSDEINLDGFNIITNLGQRDLKLWLQQYQEEGDIIRYSGVDMHTGDFIYLDMSKKYSYLSASKDACMNVAPRFGTLSSRYMSSSAKIVHDGVELFA